MKTKKHPRGEIRAIEPGYSGHPQGDIRITEQSYGHGEIREATPHETATGFCGTVSDYSYHGAPVPRLG